MLKWNVQIVMNIYLILQFGDEHMAAEIELVSRKRQMTMKEVEYVILKWIYIAYKLIEIQSEIKLFLANDEKRVP